MTVQRQIGRLDLIEGLGLFGAGRYHAIRVFADDLSPSAAADAVEPEWESLSVPDDCPQSSALPTKLRCAVHANGVIQLAYAGVGLAVDSPLAPLKVALERCRHLKSIEREPSIAGFFESPFAVLISTDCIHAFTMQLSSTGWRAADGPLIAWVKSHLLPSTPTTNLLVDGLVFQQRPGTTHAARYERGVSLRSDGAGIGVPGTIRLSHSLTESRWHGEVHIELGGIMDPNDSGELDLSTRDCATPEEALRVARELIATMGIVVWGAGCV